MYKSFQDRAIIFLSAASVEMNHSGLYLFQIWGSYLGSQNVQFNMVYEGAV